MFCASFFAFAASHLVHYSFHTLLCCVFSTYVFISRLFICLVCSRLSCASSVPPFQFVTFGVFCTLCRLCIWFTHAASIQFNVSLHQRLYHTLTFADKINLKYMFFLRRYQLLILWHVLHIAQSTLWITPPSFILGDLMSKINISFYNTN